MATRFYLQSSGSAPVNPSYDGGWEQTGEADRVILISKLQLDVVTTLTNKQVTVPNTTTQDILNRQFVSQPIPPTNFRASDTVSLVVRCFENANSNNATLAVVVKVVSQDGSILRGTLYSNFNTGTEFPLSGSAATRIVNAAALSALNTLPGDRLVVEIGVHAASPTAAGSANQRFGSSASSDFALTSGLTSDLNPYIELSTTLWAIPFNNHQQLKVGNGMSTGEKIR